MLVWFPNDCVEQRFQGISVTVVSVTLATQVTLSCLRIPVAWSSLRENSQEESYLTSDYSGKEGAVVHIVSEDKLWLICVRVNYSLHSVFHHEIDLHFVLYC